MGQPVILANKGLLYEAVTIFQYFKLQVSGNSYMHSLSNLATLESMSLVEVVVSSFDSGMLKIPLAA